MAGAPRFKVYSIQNEYVAACKFVEDAAGIIALYGGGTIRYGHAKRDTIWHEGFEDQPAADSFDYVREVVVERVKERHAICDAHPHKRKVPYPSYYRDWRKTRSED